MLKQLFTINLYKKFMEKPRERKYISSISNIPVDKIDNIDVVYDSTLKKELDEQTYNKFQELAIGMTCINTNDYNLMLDECIIPVNICSDIAYYKSDVSYILQKIKN